MSPTDAKHSEKMRLFTKRLLDDVAALELMIERQMFETGIRRIGVEQEMFLVDRQLQPAPVNEAVLAEAKDPRLTVELARFNLEANTEPRIFTGTCLSDMEAELRDVVLRAQAAGRASGADVLLTGILPTLRPGVLTLENMTPSDRYQALNDSLRRSRGEGFRIAISGIDDLDLMHDNVMLESSNTSFQIHFQVGPEEFAKMYNVAQAVTAPVLAAAVNSPLFLGKRLWHETRLALFLSAIDERTSDRSLRAQKPRVRFGDEWIRDSVLELFREQIARFRVIFPVNVAEDPLAEVRAGRAPKLRALCLHNSTTYGWNRACYGVSEEGRAHLRIENRVLPAGPTVVDEVANAAFYFGLMSGVVDRYEDVTEHLAFVDAKENFYAAARQGLGAQFKWFEGHTYPADVLILEHLLPLAHHGLEIAGIAPGDRERYLGVIAERVRLKRTGARWMLDSLAGMGNHTTPDVRERSLVAATLQHQQTHQPVHTWPLATLRGDEHWKQSYRTVGQFMTTDLFTVRPEDLVDFAASVMDWRHIRHVPVEDDEGCLVGIITHRTLLRLVARGTITSHERIAVSKIMHTDPVTVTPQTTTLEAMRLMRDHQIACLPVVHTDKLVGIITQSDLIKVSERLLERYLLED